MESTRGAEPEPGQGDFSIYVWGGQVVANASKDSERVFRSGTWFENQTGAPGDEKGVVRDEVSQFLRIDVRGGILNLVQEAGIAQWAAPSFHYQVDGTVSFREARLDLEAANSTYQTSNRTVDLGGFVTMSVVKDGGGFAGVMAAEDATIDVAPRPKPAPADELLPSALEKQGGIVGTPFAPSDSAPGNPWLPVGIGALILTSAGVGFVLNVRRTDRDALADRFLLKSQAALTERQGWRAGLFARMARLHRPQDLDSLFMEAASLLQRGKEGGVVRLLQPRMRGRTRVARLAYLLGLAQLRSGRKEEAARWLDVAAKDPMLRAQVEADLGTGPLQKTVPRERPPDQAYA